MFTSFALTNSVDIERVKKYARETKRYWDKNGDKYKEKYGSRVFWQWKEDENGKYKHRGQPIGKTFFYGYPKDVANWLGLANFDDYKGHSVPRTGTTLFANNGATPLQIKHYGNWKSMKVATHYHAQSAASKINASQSINDAIYELCSFMCFCVARLSFSEFI